MKYPHFKIGLLLLGSMAILAAVFYAAEKSNERAARIVFTSPLTVTSADSADAIDESSQTIDTDGDGLMDWEESLWGTDKNKADTDGDGTKDNDEIRVGRNPLVKGPRDSLASTTQSGLALAASTTLTATDRFSRDFFAKYMNLKQTGQVDDSLSQRELVDSLILNPAYVAITETYTRADISITPVSDTATLTIYAQQILTELKKFQDLKGDETVILRDALSEENPKLLDAITPIVDRYNSVLKRLKVIQTPEAMADLHISLMNSLSTLITIDMAFKNVFNDPLTAMQALGKLTSSAEKMAETLVLMKKRFDVYKISFPL